MKYVQLKLGQYLKTVDSSSNIVWDDRNYCSIDKLLIDGVDITQFELYPLVGVSTPIYDSAFQIVMEMEPKVVNGVWTQQWLVSQITSEELEAKRLEKIPESVTPRQFRRALIQVGLFDIVNAFMTTQSIGIKTDWEYATEIRRDYPGWDMFAAAVGKTPLDVDDIFMLAGSL